MQPPRWTLRGRQASIEHTAFRGTIDVGRPDLGVQCTLRRDAGSAEMQILKVNLPVGDAVDAAEMIECYARGSDLVATYAESSSRPVRTQIYWRAWRAGSATGLVALELVVSVQTHLLDSDPVLMIESRVPAGETFRLADQQPSIVEPLRLPAHMEKTDSGQSCPSCVIVRPPGQDWSYVEMVHPLDFQRSEVADATDGQTRLVHELFAQRLEKGVILRARLRGYLVPRAGDAVAALQCYQDFGLAEPPLTT